MSKYKAKGNWKGLRDETAYADGKTMSALTQYLCTVARPAGTKTINPEACRTCESQCAFGKRYVQLYDAGQQPVKRTRGEYKPRQKKQASKKEKPVSTTTILAETEKLMRRRLLPEANTTDNGGAHTWQTARAVIS